ncbi:MAG: hypothetical protein NC102_09695 [Clostridium sp.]|nr:hypothetical protein [Clostridium sp.]
MFNIVVPNVCRVCGQSLAKGEDLMCLGCRLELPRTQMHRDAFNEVHKRLGHKCSVWKAAGWFYYLKQSPYTRMLIDAKYSGQPSVDYRLGAMCAEELGKDGFFEGIDFLVPMPMHWTKRWLRGYNQAERICTGIESVTGIPTVKAIRARRAHGVQSRKGRDERFASITGTLELSDDWPEIAGKHVLFVDDIITTGASAAEAVQTLWRGSPKSVSVLGLGLTRNE